VVLNLKIGIFGRHNFRLGGYRKFLTKNPRKMKKFFSEGGGWFGGQPPE